ncbi:hypothetical protein C8F01DRAFT_367439 [Mycena amicta]|nr:hypothetical protein C8F01DRAFT_367439 [Mycena amicta]
MSCRISVAGPGASLCATGGLGRVEGTQSWWLLRGTTFRRGLREFQGWWKRERRMRRRGMGRLGTRAKRVVVVVKRHRGAAQIRRLRTCLPIHPSHKVSVAFAFAFLPDPRGHRPSRYRSLHARIQHRRRGPWDGVQYKASSSVSSTPRRRCSHPPSYRPCNESPPRALYHTSTFSMHPIPQPRVHRDSARCSR